MLQGEERNKVDRIWETFWTGGITNPLEVIEQFTYLLFIKQLDDMETEKESNAVMFGMEYHGIFDEHPEYRWSRFRQLGAPEQIFSLVADGVFPFIKELHPDGDSAYAKYMGDAVFKIPTAAMLVKVIEGIDQLDLAGEDSKGDLYEYLLSKIATAGTNGQFRTPRHIIDVMVEIAAPRPSDVIVDPAMGSAGFLVGAESYVRAHYGKELATDTKFTEHFHTAMFHGYDMDRTMLRIGAMNMLLHGVENPDIAYKDSLSEKNEDAGLYTLVLANPPFKGSLDAESVADSLLAIAKTKKTELLFLSLFLRILKIGGRAAVIVPDGVLFGSSKAHKEIRRVLVDENKLTAVISMPSGVFKPYAGVSTAILVFTKIGRAGAGTTDEVWFYDMHADGYTLDDKRQPTGESDIPDILTRFHHLDGEASRKRTEQSFFVPVEDIRKNGYDLSLNKYKEIEYVPVEYPSTEELLGKIAEADRAYAESVEKLREMLG